MKGMDRIDVLNLLIERRGYQRYLEIGCEGDDCFSRIGCATKIGVDPRSGGTHRTTSDAFFAAARAAGESFDLILVDGDHHHHQVLRDVENALGVLGPGGCVVLHDCLPPGAEWATPERLQDSWCGTVWRAFVKLRERADLDCVCGDFDFGVGIVRVLPNTAPIVTGKSMDELSWDDFFVHRREWMRPLSVAEVRALIAGPWPT
jgi:SAM-dependent methyltransferase